jgi:hypothetical protein
LKIYDIKQSLRATLEAFSKEGIIKMLNGGEELFRDLKLNESRLEWEQKDETRWMWCVYEHSK